MQRDNADGDVLHPRSTINRKVGIYVAPCTRVSALIFCKRRRLPFFSDKEAQNRERWWEVTSPLIGKCFIATMAKIRSHERFVVDPKPKERCAVVVVLSGGILFFFRVERHRKYV